MGFTSYQISLALLLVFSGSINTIAVKWMDMMEAVSSDSVVRKFLHPYFQADIMFFGEILCLVAFGIIFYVLSKKNDGSVDENPITKGGRGFNRFILCPAALLDIAGTSTMYMGLTMTNASSFQMLRGSIIVFVALLSMIVLKRKIKIREWIGIAFIIIALAVVGAADIMTEKAKKVEPVATTTTEAAAPEGRSGDTAFVAESVEGEGSNAIIGDLLIILAQLISACQMIYEEIFVTKLDIPPLQMVGYEGVFGFCVLSVLLYPLTLIPLPKNLKDQNASGTMEDVVDALTKFHNHPMLFVPMMGLILSIAFYNYAGVSMTKEINATTRMVLDSVRILVVWCFSLAVGWQQFHYLQIIGFIFLILGMFIYNNIFVEPVVNIFKKK